MHFEFEFEFEFNTITYSISEMATQARWPLSTNTYRLSPAFSSTTEQTYYSFTLIQWTRLLYSPFTGARIMAGFAANSTASNVRTSPAYTTTILVHFLLYLPIHVFLIQQVLRILYSE